MRYVLGVITGLAVAMMMSLAHAADFKPAVIYDMGGKFDKSFNEGVYNGIKRFEEETGVKVMEFEVTNETQREQAMQRMVQRGATVVLGVGFAQADAIDKVAKANPDRNFAIIDVNWLNQPNLRQYAFKEHEGSYLVGVAAAILALLAWIMAGLEDWYRERNELRRQEPESEAGLKPALDSN